MLSKRCSYGIRAIVYLASLKDKQYIPIKQISDELSIPFHFLTKILQQLTANNIMVSHRGPYGGVILTRAAASLTLLEIVRIIDGLQLLEGCMLGLGHCKEEDPCPVHEQDQMKAKLRTILEQTTVDELVRKVEISGLGILR